MQLLCAVHSAKVQSQSGPWPQEAKQQLDALQTAANGPDPRAAATRSIFLRNVLMRVPAFRTSLLALKAQPGDEAQPFTHFVRLQTPAFMPAAPDQGLSFSGQPIPQFAGAAWSWIGTLSLDGSGTPAIVAANSRQVRLSTGATLPFPGGRTSASPTPHSVLAVDFNYDFKSDLVLAGAGGVRFFRQDNPASFTDVTSATKLPAVLLNGPYTGAWAVDIEADGDLDIVLGAATGVPVVLRNNGDNTFQPIHPFAGVSGIRQFAWADFNGDGNPDAALMDAAGHLHVFLNERSGNFREIALPAQTAAAKAIAVGDADHSGPLSLLVAAADGLVYAMNLPNDADTWAVTKLKGVAIPATLLNGDLCLTIGDFDNNGAFDLLASSSSSTQPTAIWLQGTGGKFSNSRAASIRLRQLPRQICVEAAGSIWLRSRQMDSRQASSTTGRRTTTGKLSAPVPVRPLGTSA